MARPIRIEFAGAVYHVTSRGDRREAIFEDDADRYRFLEVLGSVVQTYNWRCHAYCLMSNHDHLVVETVDGNLSKGMRQLNGVFTQWSNRRHRRSGHLFQGRYKAILVDSESYLLELARYVVLNPVRAGMVDHPAQWPWSSYLPTVGKVEAPSWLPVEAMLAQFSKRRQAAIRAYDTFVLAGIGADSIWENLNRQMYLGNESFVNLMLAKSDASQDLNIPRAQRRPPAASLEEIERTHACRNEGIYAAWATGEYSYSQIAAHYGLFFTTVGRIVRSMADERKRAD